ncbi:MAG TPA: Ig-like domain-containing protein, partial [Longimicrobiaceae bacterium]
MAAAVIFAACTDGSDNPAGPGTPPVVQPPHTPNDAIQIECKGDIRQLTVTCGAPGGSSKDATLPNGVYLGNQGVTVKLVTDNRHLIASDTFAFDVRIVNLLPQAIGTTDGTTADAAGSQIFFAGSPPISMTGGTGQVQVANPEAMGLFTAANQPYYRYVQRLAPGDTSTAQTWKLRYTDASSTFTFLLFVYTPVQYPQGWIDITPKADTLNVGQLDTLVGVVRNHIGQPVGGPITWSSDKPDSVSVTPLGSGDSVVVTALGKGFATITATSPSGMPAPYGQRTGTATVLVNSTFASKVDTFQALRNVTVPRAAPGLLRKFSDSDGDALQVVAGTFTTAQGGIARVNADGSFDYLPAANYSGLDSLTYTVTDGVHNVPGKVILPVTSNRVWYVQAGATGTKDGRDRFPFATITEAEASAAAGDSILVLANGATQIDDGATLKNSQALIGQGIPSGIYHHFTALDSVAVLAAGAAPGLTRTTAGAAVTLAQNNTIRGVGITAAGGAAIA